MTAACKHSKEEYICRHCKIPMCNSCWHMAETGQKIPKALANDNIIGYVEKFLVTHNVTWIEATIACPIFTGLVTYYIEGDFAERHHLMEADVGKPQRAYGVRGNLFSCLLPWEWIQQQLSAFFEKMISPAGSIPKKRFCKSSVYDSPMDKQVCLTNFKS